MISNEAKILLRKLSSLAHKGPIPSIGHGASTVGMTLLDALDIKYQTIDKPRFMGIVVNGRRRIGGAGQNRVNLFARVPCWEISECKSSRQLVEDYGYDADDGVRKLYCTVQSHHQNSQGLYMNVNKGKGILEERIKINGEDRPVVSWRIKDLKEILAKKHPQTMWVIAVVSEKNGREYFHYREATYTSSPKVDQLVELLDEGTITLDC